jgi:hypothetical protein
MPQNLPFAVQNKTLSRVRRSLGQAPEELLAAPKPYGVAQTLSRPSETVGTNECHKIFPSRLYTKT